MGIASNSLKAALLAGMVVFCASCATTNVNPPSARARKGYIDLYSPGNTNLFWSVKRAAPGSSEFQTVFYKLKPLPDGVLRLELDPGPQQLQITFLNRVIEAPLTLQVSMQQGMVTPVEIELVPVAATSIQRKEEQFGANVSGAGRKTRYSTQAGSVERLVASVQPPAPYRPKQEMSYPR